MYCIYRIRNKTNGKTYIGQHKYKDENCPMGKYKGSGKILWQAYNKEGFDNFETEILYSRIQDKETVDAMEIWAIEKYKPEYNIAKGGTGGDTMSGRHWTDKQRQSFSKHMKGRKFPGRKNSGQFGQRPAWNKGLTGYKGHKSNNGQHWFNNGVVSIMAFECPEGFVKGRLK